MYSSFNFKTIFQMYSTQNGYKIIILSKLNKEYNIPAQNLKFFQTPDFDISYNIPHQYWSLFLELIILYDVQHCAKKLSMLINCFEFSLFISSVHIRSTLSENVFQREDIVMSFGVKFQTQVHFYFFSRNRNKLQL